MNLNQHLRKFFFSNNCGICNKVLGDDSIYICNSCKERILSKKFLKTNGSIYYLFKYDQDIKNLIKTYKFQNRKYIGNFIGNLIEKDLKLIIKKNNIDLIIPVPLSKNKENSRGFNQINFLLDILNIQYETAIRIRDTKPMSSILDKNIRKINIHNSFTIPFNVNNKNILIIDDIITTGSTTKELIREVKSSGKPRNIFIFSFSAASSFHF